MTEKSVHDWIETAVKGQRHAIDVTATAMFYTKRIITGPQPFGPIHWFVAR